MGNTIFAMPLAAEIRKRAPNARLVIVTAVRSDADAARLFDLGHGLCVRGDIRRFAPEEWVRVPPEALDADFAFCAFTTSARPAVMGLLWRARARVRHAGAWDRLLTHAVPIQEGRHEVRLNLDLLAALGEDLPEDGWQDYPPVRRVAEAPQPVNAVEGPLVAIHPGSGGQMAAKRWMPERFAAAADAVQGDLRARVVFVGGPSERALAASVVEHMRTTPLNLVGETSVAELAALLQRCDALLSSDTGVLHLGTAVGVPCVGIYGPTDWKRTGPFGAGHILLRANLDCAPCYSAQTMGRDIACVRQYECLRAITVGQVVEAVSRVLAQPKSGVQNHESVHDD